MNDKLQLAQNLNLRLQAQLEQAEQNQNSLVGFIFELQKVAGVPGENLNTQELYNRVQALVAKENEASAGAEEE